MFREVDKLDTDISPLWLRAAFVVSFSSIVITLALGAVYFGTYSHMRFACDVMAAMLVHRNNKFFLLWELTSIFMQTV